MKYHLAIIYIYMWSRPFPFHKWWICISLGLIRTFPKLSLFEKGKKRNNQVSPLFIIYIILSIEICKKRKNWHVLGPRTEPTLLRQLGIPLSILAVIINNKVPLHPGVILLLTLREVPRVVLIPPMIGRRRHTRRERILPLASVHIELFVRRHERRLLPVRLLQPASRRPVIRVPDAREQVHRLLIRKEVVRVVCVLENSHRYFVHEPPVCLTT